MGKFPDKKYARPGMNVVGCENCGKPMIYIPFSLEGFARLEHTCSEKREGYCRSCNRTSIVEFIRMPGPAFISPEEAQIIKGRLE